MFQLSSSDTNDGPVNIYHAYPPNKSNDNAILFFTDIFGLALAQNRLYIIISLQLPNSCHTNAPFCSLADSYARAGYLVLLPDYFKGDPIPVNSDGFNRTAWRDRHPQAEVTSIIETTVKHARETLKVKKLGAAGFCFGGPYVVRQLAAGKGVDAGFIAHPGPFTNAELNAITGPLTIAAAGKFCLYPMNFGPCPSVDVDM
jgi:dienelactone hydrolase